MGRLSFVVIGTCWLARLSDPIIAGAAGTTATGIDEIGRISILVQKNRSFDDR